MDVESKLFRGIKEADYTTIKEILDSMKDDSIKFDLLWKGNEAFGSLTALQFLISEYVRNKGALSESKLTRILRLLLEHGALTEIPEGNTASGESALWMAVRYLLPVVVIKMLLDFKADIYATGNLILDDNDSEDRNYSILHLAVKLEAQTTVIRLLINAGKDILLNDQRNPRRLTPLMLACIDGNYGGIVTLLHYKPDLLVLDGNGKSAYVHATGRHDYRICRELESNWMNSHDCMNEADDSRRSLYLFHQKDDWYLEAVYQVAGEARGDERHTSEVDRWFDRDGEEIHWAGKDSVKLPVNGLWQWNDEEWIETRNNTGDAIVSLIQSKLGNNKLPVLTWTRLRQRIFPVNTEETESFPAYLQEAIKLVIRAEDLLILGNIDESTLTEDILKLYDDAIEMLLDNLREESNEGFKTIVAAYVQNVMTRLDELKNSEMMMMNNEGSGESEDSLASGLVGISRLHLPSVNDLVCPSHSQPVPIVETTATTTKTANGQIILNSGVNGEGPSSNPGSPSVSISAMMSVKPTILGQSVTTSTTSESSLKRFLKKKRSSFPFFAKRKSELANDSDANSSSDTSLSDLIYCPVCSRKLDQKSGQDHLNDCLTNADKNRIIGDRFTVSSFVGSPNSNINEFPAECPICYEDFEAGQEIATLNCMCRFHEKCRKDWFGRGRPSCPFHP